MTYEEAKNEYITGDISLRKLAEKGGLNPNTLEGRSKREHWSKLRAEHRRKVTAKASSSACAREIDRLKRLRNASDKAVRAVEKIAKDTEQYFLHTYTDPASGEIFDKRLDKANMADVRQLTSALKDLTYTLRNLYDMPGSSYEAEKLELARRQMALNERKAAAGMPDENETGVILLPDAREEE